MPLDSSVRQRQFAVIKPPCSYKTCNYVGLYRPSGLAVCCARTDRPRCVSSLEACVSLGISDLINLTLPPYMYLSHPSNSSTKLSTSLLPATNFSLLVCPAKLIVYTCHKPFETLCRTGRGMAMASVLSAQGARSGVPARLAHASTG